MRENRSRVNANITGSRRSRLAVFLLAVAAAVSAAPPSSAWAQKVARGATEKAKARSTLVDAGFRSESLQREMHYRVLLPAGYESSEKRYPTLYLLHGLYGDFKNWSTLTHLADWAERLDWLSRCPTLGTPGTSIPRQRNPTGLKTTSLTTSLLRWTRISGRFVIGVLGRLLVFPWADMQP